MFIRALPTMTIIDHMARVRREGGLNQPAFRLVLDLLKDDRFWVKLCSFDNISAVPQAHVPGSLPYLDMVPFAQVVIAAVPDRVLWGTDWPHGRPSTDHVTALFSRFDSIGNSTHSIRSARCSESRAGQPHRLLTGFTPGNGCTPHLVGVGNNRIGMEWSGTIRIASSSRRRRS